MTVEVEFLTSAADKLAENMDRIETCLAEMPSLRSTFSKYKEEGVEFIGVNLDHPSVGIKAVRKCIADHKMTWPQYYQGDGWESEFSQS